MDSIRLKARAKINLGLDVLGKREGFAAAKRRTAGIKFGQIGARCTKIVHRAPICLLSVRQIDL